MPKSTQLLFNSATSVPANTTRTSPVVGNVVDYTTANGGEIHARITNGTSAPGAGATIEIQASPDGVLWTFYDQVNGDTQIQSSGGGGSGTIPVDRGVNYIRAIAFGNTTNAVTVDGVATIVPGA